MGNNGKLAEILLVEDNEGDIELAKEAFEETKLRNNLHIARDGDEALDFLFNLNGYEDAPMPDLVLLDLNLPKTDGREVLEKVKADRRLRNIPIVIMTSSRADKDVLESYNLHANCYIVKPVDVSNFMEIVSQIRNFWIDIVCLPTRVDEI